MKLTAALEQEQEANLEAPARPDVDDATL